MRIVQTFWSQNKNVMDNTFGWLSPEHHIMGWAYSCLKLREYYEDVQLYTDINGASVLIDHLGLPYTLAHRCYDNINHLNEHLWALPKILTYKAQLQPFIHVDGDVFIWNKFADEVEKSGLIAQNLETGTAYGKILMNDVERSVKNIPQYLKNELRKGVLSSYNAGVLGGNDIDFIHYYCNEAISLVYGNEPQKKNGHLSSNFNLLFEQILLSVLCSENGKKVTPVLPRTFDDNGYTTAEIADFSAAPYRLGYLHLIGSKKRDTAICELLSRSLLKDYPEMFFRIKALFKDRHRLYHSKIRQLSYAKPYLKTHEPIEGHHQDISYFQRTLRELNIAGFKSTEQDGIESILAENNVPEIAAIFQFESLIRSHVLNWKEIPVERLLGYECRAYAYFSFFYESKEHQLSTIFERNAHLEIVVHSFDWTERIKMKINEILLSYAVGYSTGIAVVPQLFENGYDEIVIDELDYNILLVLNTPRTLAEIISLLSDCFPDTENHQAGQEVFDLVMLKIKHLLARKCMFITFKSANQA